MSRRFQFSLRALLVALTATCLWLGWRVGQEQKQREAVEAIKAAGGDVLYDWEVAVADWSVADGWVLVPEGTEIPRPEWLRNLIAEEFLQDVTIVFLYTEDIPTDALIVRLRDIPKLHTLYLSESFGINLERKVAVALPHCHIVRQVVSKGILLRPGPPTPVATWPKGSANSSPEQIEALELQGFEGMTPRATK